MASDFAISRFKYIVRLLLVHGHWNYDRLARMILYFFYKNATFVFAYFWFQLYCGFSGAVMIDQMYLMLYNLLFTSLPPVAIGKIFIVHVSYWTWATMSFHLGLFSSLYSFLVGCCTG